MSAAATCEIAVVDYRAGNLTSVVKALHAVGANVEVTSDPGRCVSRGKIVLPGVGHFAATQFLRGTRSYRSHPFTRCSRRAVSRHLRRSAVAL